jgi:NADP-dependent 3-hydroxy acid dehydrogenase YdfG
MEAKVILISNAVGCVGAAAARLLAQAGHKLVLGACHVQCAEPLAQELRATGADAEVHALNVADADDFQSFVLAAHRRHGRVDVLVNNAEIMPLSRLDNLKIREWDRMIDVNLRGALYGIAAVLPLMQQARSGQIINLAALAPVGPATSVYSATKYGLAAISEGLRREVDGDIRVTVVSSEAVPGASDPDAIARTIAFAVNQPDDLDVSEIVVRSTTSPY